MFSIRPAVGGFIVERMDPVSGEVENEIVFTSKLSALGFLRAELPPGQEGGGPDADDPSVYEGAEDP